MFKLRTLNDALALATGRGDRTVMMAQESPTQWSAITSNQLYGRVRALADALGAWGIAKGDRVALLCENRWEWGVVDFAVLAVGGVDVPLYPTLMPDQIGYMLRDSGAKAVFVSNREQYEKIREAGDLPDVEHVVVMDPGQYEGAISLSELMNDAGAREKRDAAFDAMLQRAEPEDLATIIYTSGTTGEPKGVMLTHGNLASNLNYSTGPLGLGEEDVSISFLPLSHVTARHLDYALLCHGTKLAYCAKFEQLAEAMKIVRPTIFVAVPRVYEKIRQAVEAKSAASPLKHRIFNWAFAVGKQHRGEIIADRRPSGFAWKLANKLVFSKIIEAFGGRTRIFIAGGAPLGVDTGGWFADAGISILEGYGLTETSPVIALNYPQTNKIGTVGRPLENVQCRFAEDGELEVKGPSVFPGYWNKDDQTREAFTPDGWFRTGDIGNQDAEGFLSITDRKKELLKTSGGKLIAPQPIENRLKANTLVGNAAMVGDKHKFACVLISPNASALKSWASGQGIAADELGLLVRDPKVVRAYEEIVDRVNQGLAPFESIKRICVVPEEWSVETDELTPSMKLKRRVIERKYSKQIEAFYADEATAKACENDR